MKWVDGTCVLTDAIRADVWDRGKNGWGMAIYAYGQGETLWAEQGFHSESAAKSAVAAWIGKTMAQLSNALAAGEIRVDEE